MSDVIRVAIVDDHPAIRAGLEVLLGEEPDLVAAGTAARGEEVAPLLYRTAPDVVLLDYHLPGADGLRLCRRIKSQPPAPAVLIYSAYTGDLAVPALVAGADGLIGKGGPAGELLDAIRRCARGERVLATASPAQMRAAARELAPEDLPILGMLVERTPPREIAQALRCTVADLNRRIAGMLAALRGGPLGSPA
jgi:DNA-binding NarL/FixJ family response regulator